MPNEARYRGFIVRHVNHPTPINPSRMTWDICKDGEIKKSNIGSFEVAKHYIDMMLQYGYWTER